MFPSNAKFPVYEHTLTRLRNINAVLTTKRSFININLFLMENKHGEKSNGKGFNAQSICRFYGTLATTTTNTKYVLHTSHPAQTDTTAAASSSIDIVQPLNQWINFLLFINKHCPKGALTQNELTHNSSVTRTNEAKML